MNLHVCRVCQKKFTSKRQRLEHLGGRKHKKAAALHTPIHALAAVEPPVPRAKLDVLYRDRHLVAVNKPSGLLVHRTPLASGQTDTVLDRLREDLPGLKKHLRPVHRLDRGTSGVLVFALSRECAHQMSLLFQKRGSVHKLYVAAVRGWLADPLSAVCGEICEALSLPLSLDKKRRHATKQAAVTRWTQLTSTEIELPAQARELTGRPHFATARYSLIAAEPVTGRWHQIRRHLAHAAHPVLGDSTHGDKRANRAIALLPPVAVQRGIVSSALKAPPPTPTAPTPPPTDTSDSIVFHENKANL